MPKGKYYGAQFVYPEGMTSDQKKKIHAKATYEAKKAVRLIYTDEYEGYVKKFGNATLALNALGKNHPELIDKNRQKILTKMLEGQYKRTSVEPQHVNVMESNRVPLVKEVRRKGFFARMLSVVGL